MSHRAAWLACLGSLIVGAGCTQNSPYVMQTQLDGLQQSHASMVQAGTEIQSRLASLDRDNLELEKLLAQERQRNQVYNDQVAALREQLRGTADRLSELQDQYVASEEKARTIAASTQRRVGAQITANNSLKNVLPQIDLAGVQVRRDGDVIRIELPADQLFEADGVRLSATSATMLRMTADSIRATHPDQLIGVEGHTDANPSAAPTTREQHLSVNQAMAVYEYLATNTYLKTEQMFVVGHGGNHPLVSNATAAGKQRNRRVELVIYPERPGR